MTHVGIKNVSDTCELKKKPYLIQTITECNAIKCSSQLHLQHQATAALMWAKYEIITEIESWVDGFERVCW